MTELKTILENGFDATIVTPPTFYYRGLRSPDTLKRGVTVGLSASSDMVIGITDRHHYDPEAYDAYNITIVAATEDDIRLILKGIQKVCAEYVPVVGEENIITWEDGEWTCFVRMWWRYDFVILKRKGGIQHHS